MTVAHVGYDTLVRIMTAYTGVFSDVRVYPIRTISVCGECSGAGRDMSPPYGKCIPCNSTGYPGGVRPETVPATSRG